MFKIFVFRHWIGAIRAYVNKLASRPDSKGKKGPIEVIAEAEAILKELSNYPTLPLSESGFDDDVSVVNTFNKMLSRFHHRLYYYNLTEEQRSEMSILKSL